MASKKTEAALLRVRNLADAAQGKAPASAEPDFSGEAAAPNTAALELIPAMVERLRELRQRAAAAEEAFTRAADELARYQMIDLPDAMQAAGLSELTLQGGAKLKVKDDLKVSITEANRDACHAWLRDHGHGASIKTFLELDIRAMPDEQRAMLVAEMRLKGLEPEAKESVHNATLKSLVKELLEGGTTLPPSFSLHQFKKAELKESK